MGNTLDVMQTPFENLFHGTLEFDKTFMNNLPAIVKEENEQYVVEVEVPGVKRENIDITHEDRDTLVVTVDTNDTDTPYYTVSRNHPQKRRRAFLVGKDVDVSRTTANLEDGILRIVLPKNEEAQPRKIEIN